MPRIIDLFKNQPLASQGGKTAQEAYAIRDSKDIDISVADPLVNNTGILLAKGARKLASFRTDENFIEEELTGVRIIRTGAMPVIYGSDIARLTLRTTPTLDRIKNATFGELSDSGGLGGQIKGAADSVRSTLGLPTTATPTFVVEKMLAGGNIQFGSPDNPQNEKIDLSITQDRMNDLTAIKTTAAGSLLGQLLAKSGGGNLKTIGKQALGGAIQYGKQQLREKLFGGNERKPAETTEDGITFKGSNLYATSPDLPLHTFKEGLEKYRKLGVNYGSNTDVTPDSDTSQFRDFNDEVFNKQGSSYTNTNNINPIAAEVSDRNTLAEKQAITLDTTIKFSSQPDRAPKFGEKISRREYNTDDFIENKYSFNSAGDAVNASGVYSGDNETLDNQDFITLKFKSIPLNKSINFRSTITGLTETFTPSWESSNFIGNPFSFYTYTSIERSVSFNFDAFSLNAQEHKTMWDKLNFLQGLTYPQGYYPTSAVKPPLIELTLGSMYKKKVAFIDSLSFTTEDNVPWNIADSVNYVTNITSEGVRQISTTPEDVSDYKLPMVVSVSIGLKFLESRSTTQGRKFYSFTPQTN